MFVYFHHTVSFKNARPDLSGSYHIPGIYHSVSQNKLSINIYSMDNWFNKLHLGLKEGLTFLL